MRERERQKEEDKVERETKRERLGEGGRFNILSKPGQGKEEKISCARREKERERK